MLAVPVVLLASIAPAMAQEQRSGVVRLEEITVTAQKREQLASEVPMSLTVFAAPMLERENIENIRDYVLRTPNVLLNQVGPIGFRGGVGISVRGVSGRTNYYFDETPVPTTDVRLFDIERVEVLRGPQGTLYGDSAMGGTVRVITNKPTFDSFDAMAGVGYSFTEDGSSSYFGESFVNVPLSDRVALRVAGYFEEIGGYIDNTPPLQGRGDQTGGGLIPFNVDTKKDANRADRTGVRAALRIRPIEDITVDLSVWLQDIHTDFRSLYLEGTPLQSNLVGQMFENQELEVYNATLNWSLGKFNLMSSATYWDRLTGNTEDITDFFVAALGFPVQFTNSLQLNNGFPADAFTTETRLSFEDELAGKPIHAQLGVYYSDAEVSTDQYWFDAQAVEDISAVLGFDFGLAFDALGVERGLLAYQQIPQSAKQLALFGEFTISPLSWLELTAGLRYFEFDISQSRTTDGFLFQGFEQASAKTTDSGVNPRFQIKADINENLFVYAIAAEGFNIGSALGSSLPDICQPALDALGLQDGPVDPESLWSYEVGMKGLVRGGRVQFDLSAFHIDWTDIQEAVAFARTGENICPDPLIGNFGDATINGGEASVSAIVTDGLRLGGSLGYSDSSRTRPPIGILAAEQVGQQQLTVSINFEYSARINQSLNGYFGGDHQYIEEGKDDVPGTPHYHVTNLRAGVLLDDTWEFQLIGRNIFDSRPALISYPIGAVGNAAPLFATLRPRTIGVEVRARF